MIEILRLKSGEDIIGEVYTDLGINGYEIHEPMSVDIEFENGQSGLVMHHWLPVQIIDKNVITIKKEDVLATFSPNSEFREYYKNTVDKLKKILEAKQIADSMTDEEIEEVMETLVEIKGKTIH